MINQQIAYGIKKNTQHHFQTFNFRAKNRRNYFWHENLEKTIGVGLFSAKMAIDALATL